MAKTFELKTTLSADGTNSSLFVDDTADYLGSPSEGANLPSAVVGLESTAFGGNVPFAGARLEGGEGTVTVSDTPNPQSVADVASNGNCSAGGSTPADGAVTSSLLVGDPASQSTGANGNVAPPDTDNSLTPTLSVNAENPADVVFTVSGLGSGYSGTVTFTDSTNKSDVVAIKGNGTYSANLSNLADGTLTYLLKASDPAGNVITVDPTTTLGLPPGVTLQPINGGPDYYANNGFTYAANAGWDNPSFLPIGPFYEAVTSEADVTLWHGLNWNTAFDVQANFDLALAGASTGIWVIQNISDGLLPGTGAETVGLITYDEPSTFAEGVTTPLSTTANSIQDGRFWYINNTWNFIEYGGLNPVNSSAQVLDTLVTTPNGTQVHIDASSVDAYWFSGANISQIQYELGLLDNLPGNATAAEVARGSNYGDIITDEEAITGGSQPIFGFVETGGPYNEDTSASDYITPAELNWAVWSQLIHGANGIDYFDHSFAGPAVSDSNVQDAYYQTVQPGQTVSIYTQIQQTDALVTQLAPVLNSPTALGYVTVNNAAYENGTILSPFSGIEVMAKDDNGQFYIFADTADALTQTNIAATFTIADTNATSVTVVGENRTIPVVDGVFSDTFATAATVHIYEVIDGGSSSPPPPPDPPAAPVISTGVANSNASVTLTGTAPDGSTVTVSDGGTTALGTATASSTGTWSFTTADLAAGFYAFTATDTTSAGSSAASSAFDVTVTSSSPPPSGSNLVANGNFATDSFSGWTLGGNYTSSYFGPEIFIDTDAEGGSTYAAGMGSVGSDGTLSQTIATTAGQTYTLSFWLQNEAAGTNDFSAIWNGQTLLSLSNAAQSGYTEYTYTVTATGSTTTLEFSAANGPSQWDLDNVSLTANSTPLADPPAAPVISTGVENSNESVTLKGTAPDGSTVTVSDGGAKALGTATASSTGAWSFTTADLSAGSYAFTATDAGTSATSNAFDVTVTGPTVIQTDTSSFGSTSLTEVGNQYYLYNSSGVGPALKQNGAAVVAGQFGAWVPIGAVQTTSGYDVAWEVPGANEYSVWSTNSSGNFISSTPIVSGTSYTLESYEPIFDQDLNGDGTIGPTTTVIQTDGSTSLTEVANEYFLYNGSGVGPALKQNGAAVVAGQFGAWVPIGAVQTTSGYDVAWEVPGANEYSVWSTNSSGNFISSTPIVSGTSYTLESYEPIFGQDLNGDGTIGPTTTVIQTDGSTSLTEVANEYFLYNGSGVGPALKQNGAAVVAGQFGAWVPIGAVQTTSGYDVAWEVPGANEYSVWSTNSSGNFISSTPIVSGTSYTLESYQPILGQDLNGDGTIGPTTTVIQTDGSTSLTEVANEYFLYNGSGVGPALKQNGAAVVAGQFGAWVPIGAVQTTSGYDVAWEVPGANEYSVWSTDSSGNFISSTPIVSGTSTALESYESIFNQALNGDGVIGLYAAPSTTLQISAPLADPSGSATIGAGATLELAVADSGSVTFASSTGTLILESPSTFSGEIFNFTGNGSLSGSDQIDLKGINYKSVHDSYANGVLTVTDGTDTVKLDFNGSYKLANFDFASDGSGGTIVYDPPANEPPTGGSATIGTGATLELGGACSEAVTFSGPTGTLVLGNSSTSGGQSSNFTGTVSGFGAQDVIDLPGFAFDAQTTLGYLADSNQTGGTLSLTDGAQSAKIALLGNYMASSFAVASDNHGGTMVTEASQAGNQALLTNPQHT